MKKNNLNKGFTLLEILLVVAIIAMLVGITILAINPGKQFADTRNTERGVGVNTILNAVYQYSLDSEGVLPEGIELTSGEICKEEANPTDDDCDVDLSVLVEDELYLVSLPQDPINPGSSDGIGYEISRSANGRITVSAPLSENGVITSVTR